MLLTSLGQSQTSWKRPRQASKATGIRAPFSHQKHRGYLFTRSHSRDHGCDSVTFRATGSQRAFLMWSMKMFLFISRVSHKVTLPCHTSKGGRRQSVSPVDGFILPLFHSLPRWGLDIDPIFGGQDNRGLAECSPLQPGD